MEGDEELQELYQDALLDYSDAVSHKGKLDRPDFSSRGVNPVCGDEIELTMAAKFPAGVIEKIRYAGRGCVISQASCAMMAECLEGQALPRARELVAAFKEMLLSGSPAESLPTEIKTLKALEGVRKFPLRVKCATLAWNTLQRAWRTHD